MADATKFPEHGPVLSTPDTRILEEATTTVLEPLTIPRRSEEKLNITYEIERTVNEIRAGRWERVALQFPDHMLVDAPWVSHALSRGLRAATKRFPSKSKDAYTEDPSRVPECAKSPSNVECERVFILADTSYGACCVDEVAAEHANAQVVVHYGRSCLSSTARLPVIYVFTNLELETGKALEVFRNLHKDHDEKIILMADLPFQEHVADLARSLVDLGYTSIFATKVIHDTTSPLPNRTVPEEIARDEAKLQDWALFHVSEPSPSLLLNLASRVASVHFFPTDDSTTNTSGALQASTNMSLRRRYALLTSLSTTPIFGILINTLSVRNYMSILKHVKGMISAAGKKSYTFVVGKVNAAKVANFSEVGGWVVIGCWESSLFESKDFWKPVITPFELELALKSDNERVWTGKWSSDFQAVLDHGHEQTNGMNRSTAEQHDKREDKPAESGMSDDGSEEESEPPEFDLRTGRYVSHTRPMLATKPSGTATEGKAEAGVIMHALARRPKGDLTRIGGQVSPAADFFREKRSWQGLGSDYESGSESAVMEQGRHGIAKGYKVGEEATQR